MITWGGFGYYPGNSGQRYDPITDTWISTSSVNAPDRRYGHSGVWTGTEMIVWGGVTSAYTNTGGKYNPMTDTWTPTNSSNAPDARFAHTAIWTGSEMIVWGGFLYQFGPQYLNTGGKYDPNTDTWSATTTANAPAGRWSHTGVPSGPALR
ncbi:MAG: hypothetical protein DME76_10115 [Verrucomicrobia bacterium]|nr:MAG: hypothetical protein DME76_10115 [Verrucomicrobiota bacterium]